MLPGKKVFKGKKELIALAAISFEKSFIKQVGNPTSTTSQLKTRDSKDLMGF
jgi:hypothetical protein